MPCHAAALDMLVVSRIELGCQGDCQTPGRVFPKVLPLPRPCQGWPAACRLQVERSMPLTLSVIVLPACCAIQATRSTKCHGGSTTAKKVDGYGPAGWPPTCHLYLQCPLYLPHASHMPPRPHVAVGAPVWAQPWHGLGSGSTFGGGALLHAPSVLLVGMPPVLPATCLQGHT
jgi:hypothetical protein